MSEEDLVAAYIQSDHSPDGKWWIEVPVGLSVQELQTQSMAPKHVDAVCLNSHPQQPPESYPEYDGFVEYVNPDIPESGVTRTELYRRMRESEHFNDETATIVEAKTSGSSFKAIGQLQAYKSLLEEDYGWNVTEQILLADGRDSIIEHAAKDLDIRVVNVG